MNGAPRALSFSESIYFSIVSMSTVGYGDIVPHSSLARLLGSLEVICGFMLLLFGGQNCSNIRVNIARAVAARASDVGHNNVRVWARRRHVAGG